jgi:DNA repair exonuclease SbcCD ATPase subunit
VDLIYDILDRCNDGECMICLESLRKAVTRNEERKRKEKKKGSPPFSMSSSASASSSGGHRPPLSLKTDCYHCFHIHCLCRWACEYFDQVNDQTKKVSTEQQNLSLRSLQGEIKTSESQLKRAQDELTMIEQSITDLQKSISSLQLNGDTNAGSSSSSSSLEDMRLQWTQISLQITKSSGKKKDKLFETANKLKQQIQSEERRLSSLDHGNTTGRSGVSAGETNGSTQESLLESEEAMKRLQSQLPEVENKIRKCQARYGSDVGWWCPSLNLCVLTTSQVRHCHCSVEL